jgi:hypothetical protein
MNMSNTTAFLIIIILILGGVFFQYKKHIFKIKPQDNISPEILKSAIITLERTMCEGTCPAYELTIKGDGAVEYNGTAYVEVKGKQYTKISEASFKKLVDMFYDADYFNLENEYGHIALDTSKTITSITIDGKTKRIIEADNTPEKLERLQNAIDLAVNSAQWIKGNVVYPAETILVNMNKEPVTTKSGLTISYDSARPRSYVGGSGDTTFVFMVEASGKEGFIEFKDTDEDNHAVVWEGYTITHVTGDPNTFTFNIVKNNNIYRIDDFTLSEKDFLEFKSKLTIDQSSKTTSNFEEEPGVPGGTEVHYNAVDKKTGEKYQYSEYEITGGVQRTFTITKSEVSTSLKKPDPFYGDWLLGRWLVTPNNGNGAILGKEIEFIDVDGKKKFNIYKDNKIIESGTWEYGEYSTIILTKGTVNQKFNIDFYADTGEMIANYYNPPHIGEPATGYYKKMK